MPRAPRPCRPAVARSVAHLTGHAAAALVLVGLLAACSPADDDGAAPVPTASGTSSATAPDGAAEPLARLEVADLAVELVAPDGRAHVTDGPERSRTATVTGTTALTVRLDAPSGAHLARNADATVSVVGPGDEAPTLGGLTVTGDGLDVEVGDDAVAVRPRPDPTATTDPGGSAADAPPVTVTLGADALVSATWDEAEGGRSLAVVPSDWARQAGVAGTDAVWSAVVAAQPEADTGTMHDQLECHALGAPDKASWNLEPWRPDTGLVDMALARCNPT